MEIWEERYTDENYGKEPPNSFRYFKMYLELGRARTIKELSNILSNNTNKKRIPKYKTLREYSSKWKWTKRAKSYDEYLDSILDNELLDEVLSFKKQQLTYASKRIDFSTDNLKEIKDDNELSAYEKAYAIAKNHDGYNKAVETFYKIYHDGIDKTEAKMETENYNVDLSYGFDEELQKRIIDERKNDK